MTYLRAFALPLAMLAGMAALPQQSTAAPRSATYSVTLAEALDAPRREILNGQIWVCEADRCIGRVGGSRATIACKRVAGEFGQIVHFEGPKGELGAEDLARCNAA
jgi:hypothetical protein